MSHQIFCGDCRDVMRTMNADSIDSIVSDPPYGLSFMGKSWDHGVPSVEFWLEALRVAKPGSHLLAFGGTRTFHRLTVAIEDAGWDIRDCIMWVYGSGFPKSHDVGKGIDKVNGEVGRMLKFTNWMRTTGLTARQLDKITDTNMGGHYLTLASQPAIPTAALWQLMRPHCGAVPAWVDELVDRIEAERAAVTTRKAADLFEAERDVAVQKRTGDPVAWYAQAQRGDGIVDITAPATDAARQWDGWGTALKPAWEPIIVARKPLEGTVAANVLTHGTGALNIDGCRVGAEGGNRWPANLIHDGSDDVTARFPKDVKDQKGSNGGIADSGSAARFFYCAKVSKEDRGKGNNHCTVKPTSLMRYLCRLVTSPNGIVLDPFMGSGSTGKAAIIEGFQFIGIDLNQEYCTIAENRIKAAQYEGGLFK